jgi:hypothetical protein
MQNVDVRRFPHYYSHSQNHPAHAIFQPGLFRLAEQQLLTKKPHFFTLHLPIQLHRVLCDLPFNIALFEK